MRARFLSSLICAAYVTLVASGVDAQTGAPQPDPTSSTYQATGEQDKSYVFPGTDEKIVRAGRAGTATAGKQERSTGRRQTAAKVR